MWTRNDLLAIRTLMSAAEPLDIVRMELDVPADANTRCEIFGGDGAVVIGRAVHRSHAPPTGVRYLGRAIGSDGRAWLAYAVRGGYRIPSTPTKRSVYVPNASPFVEAAP